MDYAKFVRKDMPLAVPTQKRPPDKYASHPYPFLVDEGAYLTAINPLDITLLREVLYEEIFQPSIAPLDFILRNILRSKYHDSNEAYSVSIVPKDITFISILRPKDYEVYIGGDGYKPSINPLDVLLKGILIVHKVDDKDTYTVSMKPMDITLKK